MSLNELARSAEISRAHLGRILTLRGQKSFGVDTLDKIAEALRVKARDLLPS